MMLKPSLTMLHPTTSKERVSKSSGTAHRTPSSPHPGDLLLHRSSYLCAQVVAPQSRFAISQRFPSFVQGLALPQETSEYYPRGCLSVGGGEILFALPEGRPCSSGYILRRYEEAVRQ